MRSKLFALGAAIVATAAGCTVGIRRENAKVDTATTAPPPAPVPDMLPSDKLLVIERDDAAYDAPKTEPAMQERALRLQGATAEAKSAPAEATKAKTTKADRETPPARDAMNAAGSPRDFIERRPSQGVLCAKRADGGELGEFPLKRTDVKGEIAGLVAQTRVTQTFQNTFATPIEAVYVFPLPETAAVNDFLMTVGDRRIRGIVRPREEAERIYAAARAQGYTASLLTQERPNIFTQNVANIAPQSEVKVEILYFHAPKFESGEFEWVFPMVVGPRFIPGAPAGSSPASNVSDDPMSPPLPPDESAKVGSLGREPDTDRVPDASRITPPVLPAGMRSGHDVALSVELEAGVPLGEVVVPTHACKIERVSDTRARITLDDADAIPNRDFVLRWRRAGSEPALGLVATRGERGGFFSFLLEPQLDVAERDVMPREITFLIDVSGSQSGLPLDMCKKITSLCIDRLRPRDLFNVMYFASGQGQLFDRPVPPTDSNKRDAKEWISDLRAGGATYMVEGLRRAFAERRHPGTLGIVVFMTDGYVGNDEEILSLVRTQRGDTRVFVFGTGPSVNRYLLESLAEAGNGRVQYALPRDVAWADRCVATFKSAIDAPLMSDIEIDWGSLAVSDVYPKKIADLWAGQPIVLVGRYEKGGESIVKVRARTGGAGAERRVELPLRVKLPDVEPRFSCLAPVWARAKISDLTAITQTRGGEWSHELVSDVTKIALDFRLVSPFTSFVAVDESRVVSNGSPTKIEQPVHLPEGLSREGCLGEPDAPKPRVELH